jgi:hypothetical protein
MPGTGKEEFLEHWKEPKWYGIVETCIMWMEFPNLYSSPNIARRIKSRKDAMDRA